MPMIQSRVTVEPDGALRWKGHRWVEVEPMVFRSTDRPDYSADGPDYIVFRQDDRGTIAELHAWGATYERIGWMEQAPFHLSLFACCVITFVGYATSRGFHAWRRRTKSEAGTVAWRFAVVVAVLNILFVSGLPAFFAAVRASTPFPRGVLTLWLLLPIASVAVTALLPGFAATAWWEGWWTRGERRRPPEQFPIDRVDPRATPLTAHVSVRRTTKRPPGVERDVGRTHGQRGRDHYNH